MLEKSRTWAEIDLKALENNFNIIRSKTIGDIYCVVKADAYGHDETIVVPCLKDLGAEGFAVAELSEAISVRQLAGDLPILILGYFPPSEVALASKENITVTVFSKEYAKELSDFAVKNSVRVKAHIKIDSGMGRIGFDCRTSELFGINEAKEILNLPNIDFCGIFTHFASADEFDGESKEFTKAQYDRFVTAVEILKNSGLKKEAKVHASNSASILYNSDYKFDIYRPGIILYGLSPTSSDKENHGLIPVMTLKSTVAFVKKIKAGETVSYGRTFTAKRDMTVATVTVGYADGLPRSLSNNGFMFINGKKAEILGRVCMDQTVVDVTDIENVKTGDTVTLFGKDFTASDFADTADTIAYEIVSRIAKRVPRIKV